MPLINTEVVSSSGCSFITTLLQKHFGFRRKDNRIGACLVAQIAYSISAVVPELKPNFIAKHIFDNIGIKGDENGFSFEEILKTFKLPILTKRGPYWIGLKLFEYKNLDAVKSAVITGYPVIIIIPRKVCDDLEDEANRYKDGGVIDTPIRKAMEPKFHALLAMGIEDNYTILRDTRHYYARHGYLTIHDSVLRTGFKYIKAISVCVTKVEH